MNWHGNSTPSKHSGFIDRHGKIRLIEIIERFDGFVPSTILDGIKFDFRHLRDVTHAAVVSDIGWIGVLTRAAGMVMPVTMKVFSLAELEKAREWAKTADLEITI